VAFGSGPGGGLWQPQSASRARGLRELMKQKAVTIKSLCWPQLSSSGPRNSSKKLLIALINRPMDATASIASVASAAKMASCSNTNVGDVPCRASARPCSDRGRRLEGRAGQHLQPGVLPKNPLNRSSTEETPRQELLKWPITVLDASTTRSDAKIDNLPPNQNGLSPTALTSSPVDATKNTSTNALQPADRQGRAGADP